MVRRVRDDWRTFGGTGANFNTRIDHREVLRQDFQELCYSLLVVSSATGAEVEKSKSLFKTTHHFLNSGVESDHLCQSNYSPFLDLN